MSSIPKELASLAASYSAIAFLVNRSYDELSPLNQEVVDQVMTIGSWDLRDAFGFVALCIEHAKGDPYATEWIIAGPFVSLLYRHGIEKCATHIVGMKSVPGFVKAAKYLLESDRSRVLALVRR